MPYFFFLFAICYSDYFSVQVKRIVRFVLLIPPIGMIFFVNLWIIFPNLTFNWQVMFAWVGPYFTLAFFFLIASYVSLFAISRG